MEAGLAIGLGALVAGALGLHYRRRRRLAFIEGFEFPAALRRKLARRRPTLKDQDLDLVLEGLRDWFWVCNRGGRRPLSMPSQVVDDAWHELILFTRAYHGFCRRAFGRFLHHSPAEAMGSPTRAGEGIRRTWRIACAREGIDPAHPARLPTLFALDAMLGIDDGFHYALDCKDPTSPLYGSGYCASHIGCGSGCAGDSGASGSGCGCGSGDGGGGCGGD